MLHPLRRRSRRTARPCLPVIRTRQPRPCRTESIGRLPSSASSCPRCSKPAAWRAPRGGHVALQRAPLAPAPRRNAIRSRMGRCLAHACPADGRSIRARPGGRGAGPAHRRARPCSGRRPGGARVMRGGGSGAALPSRKGRALAAQTTRRCRAGVAWAPHRRRLAGAVPRERPFTPSIASTSISTPRPNHAPYPPTWLCRRAPPK